jgi:hypothetical protein
VFAVRKPAGIVDLHHQVPQPLGVALELGIPPALVPWPWRLFSPGWR